MSQKFKFLYQPWARIQSIWAALFVLTGAIITVFYPGDRLDPFIGVKTTLWMIASFSTSIYTLATEYPLLQIPILTTNYYLKGILYFVFAISGMFIAPTHTGSLCLACASLTYLKAAFNGESGLVAVEKSGKN